MLDADTKRRIDTARDILVGKLPDPKSQIDQITIALIYKFMDDMDAEAEELDGKRGFFAGEFAKYGWAQLMHSGLGGHEMLDRYAEGIVRMPENPGIPHLFREIFKNAYLPYRDPETLRLFLKTIDEFTYDHSERLGDAFEYLLSVMGSQGDAGQFRTPRHIIDFIVQIVDPKKDEVVLDPACGTAGFLISSYKHIREANRDANGYSTLTPDDNARLAQNFVGYDISPDMVRLSLVNLYLHGFADPHIHEYDTLTSEERWNDYADVILANPPFMSPKGGIVPHKRFSVTSNRSEVLFVDYILEHLTPNGRAGIIVPEGVIFQSGTAYRRLREMLVTEALIGVISLPSGVFQPYSGVKTSILILDKRIAKSRPSILFSTVEAIGVSLGIKRTIIERNDLPQVTADFAAYCAESELSPRSFLVDRSYVATNDFNLSAERYRPVVARAGTRTVRLREVCNLTKGTYSSTKTEPGPYPLIVTAKDPLSSVDYQLKGDAVCVPLISSTGHGRASISRIHFASGKFALANLLAALQSKDVSVLDTKFLYFLLSAQKGKMAALMKGAANVSMKVEDLAEFQIPLPPLELQQEIVAEIESYQRVIDGARAVVEHYRSYVDIDPNWPVQPLSDLAELIRGITFSKADQLEHATDDSLLVATTKAAQELGIVEEHLYHIPHRLLKDPSKLLHPGDILISTANSLHLLGRTTYVDKIDRQMSFGAFMSVIRPNARVCDRYLLECLRTPAAREFFVRNANTTTNISNLNFSSLAQFEIPLPPLEMQRQIVTEIETEQALVDANRELITRFEQKIQAKFARIWGDEPTSRSASVPEEAVVLH